jgi:hypothetical protein
MIKYSGWKIYYTSLHGWVGFYTGILVLVLAIGGIVSGMMHFCCEMRWKTKYLLLVGAIHKYFAYLIIILA